MPSMLEAAQEAARQKAQEVIEWALNAPNLTRAYADKCSPAQLKRAVYDCTFDILFPYWKAQLPNEPLLTPDRSIEVAVKRFAFNMFPAQTVFNVVDEKLNELLQDINKQIKLDSKCEQIVSEASLMGFVALRSVWSDLVNGWLLELKPFEQTTVEYHPTAHDIVLSVTFSYPMYIGLKKYWYKEKWTNDEYWEWPLVEVGRQVQAEPNMPDKRAIIVPNTFGEIPVTIVYHRYCAHTPGQSAFNDKDILNAKALVRLRNKKHLTHLEHLDPSLVVVNNSSNEPIKRGAGAIIRLKSDDPNAPASAELLESAGVPESVDKEINDHVVAIFKGAGLTPPSEEEILKHNKTDVPGVALRIRDKGEATTIETLRIKGYAQVMRHLEKLMRMGAFTHKTPEYSTVNLSDPTSYEVSAKFPPFFPPSDQDVLIKMNILKMSHLSAKEKAEREAQYLDVESIEEINEIQSNIEAEKVLMEPTITPPTFN